MNEDILKAGLDDESISSRVNFGSSFGVEATIATKEDIEIPLRYNRDILRILPVNVHTVYVYWELTQKRLQDFNAFFPLVLKISDEETELMRFGITDEVGSKYVNAYWNEKKLVSEIGYINEDGEFMPILASNRVIMPSDKLHISSAQTWMSKTGYFEAIIKASSQTDGYSMSSIALTKQLELAFYDARLNTLSSHAVLSRG